MNNAKISSVDLAPTYTQTIEYSIVTSNAREPCNAHPIREVWKCYIVRNFAPKKINSFVTTNGIREQDFNTVATCVSYAYPFLSYEL